MLIESNVARPQSFDVQNLADFRQTVLYEAAKVILRADPHEPVDLDGSFPKTAALLTSTLEAMRVIEENLIEQNERLLVEREMHERQLAYQIRLFDLAPCALLVTDVHGSVTEANRAALTLFGVRATDLERKPLVSLVPIEERSQFRRELGRLSVTQGVSDWRFVVLRRRDVPLRVSAAVHVVGGGNKFGGAGLFWSLRPVTEIVADG